MSSLISICCNAPVIWRTAGLSEWWECYCCQRRCQTGAPAD